MGIVYKISCNETGECYIGSTTQRINRRMESHIREATLEKYKDVCSACCVIIRRGNWKYDILETNELEGALLRIKEQEYMDKTDNIVNKWKAYISDEDIIERDRLNKIKYYQNNKEELIKKNGDRRKEKYLYTIKCECGKSYQKRSEARHFRTKTHTDYVLSSGIKNAYHSI